MYNPDSMLLERIVLDSVWNQLRADNLRTQCLFSIALAQDRGDVSCMDMEKQARDYLHILFPWQKTFTEKSVAQQNEAILKWLNNNPNSLG
jgi:hypothetical protein